MLGGCKEREIVRLLKVSHGTVITRTFRAKQISCNEQRKEKEYV